MKFQRKNNFQKMSSYFVKTKEGIEALKEFVDVLEKKEINYWLGRGLFRHYTINKKMGDKSVKLKFRVLIFQSSIEFCFLLPLSQFFYKNERKRVVFFARRPHKVWRED